jgi:plasmid stabilization system protein ParE
MKYRFHPEAEGELEAASDFYDEREFGLGEIFLNEVRGTIGRILEHPNSWPKFSHRSRRCLCNHFPYSVIYRHNETEVTIYAVAHQSRKPGYWKDRLK